VARTSFDPPQPVVEFGCRPKQVDERVEIAVVVEHTDGVGHVLDRGALRDVDPDVGVDVRRRAPCGGGGFLDDPPALGQGVEDTYECTTCLSAATRSYGALG
jgi:hypothetical protein